MCRYSRLWTENLTKTHSIELGIQTNAFSGREVGQGKGNTWGVPELWQTAAMLQPKILKFNLKRQNIIPAKQYMSAGLGAQSAALDKHLMLPRALQLDLQPPLTLEGTFHMKMCHNFAILQPFFNGPKGLSWFSQ